MQAQKPVFLVGFMASGKTTLGRALAGACPGLSFVDLDEAVEAAAGCSVADIFARSGEAVFRALESKMLREVARPGAVVACGGGTPCRPENMAFMLDAGKVVLLDASPETIVRRLIEAGPGKRPLVDRHIDDPAALLRHVETMLADRAEHYSRAEYVFDANRLDTQGQIDESVARFISEILAG